MLWLLFLRNTSWHSLLDLLAEIAWYAGRGRGRRNPRPTTTAAWHHPEPASMTRMMLFAAAFSLLPHAGAAVPQTENLAPEKRVCTGEDSAADSKCYVCEGANPGGYGGRCIEKLFKGLDLPNCQAACTPPPPLVNFSCTGATAAASAKVCAFVSQWNHAVQGEKVSLVCTPEEQCTIGGTKLGANTENGRVTDFGFQGDATMTNVLVKDMFGNKTCDGSSPLQDCRGGLMEVGSAGRVVGTNIIFRNGLVRA